jgi:S1-C subfamily serine protease
MRNRYLPTIVAAALIGAAAGQAAAAPTVAFTKVGEKLAVGSTYATLQDFILVRCKTREVLKADGVAKTLNTEVYEPIFSKNFALPNYIGRDGGANLFNTATKTTADFEIGALITEVELKLCYQAPEGDPRYYPSGINGSARTRVEWQVYDTAKRQVVATIATEGFFEVKKREQDPMAQIVTGVFAENVKQLAASPKLAELLSAAPTGTTSQPRIAVAAGPAAARPIAEATGAVVLVQTNEGHGSGFLISADGYVLTNAHVVGTSKTVKIRWSDGFETEGEVLRAHTGRDVALIKTDPRGRDPLPLRAQALASGDAVLAIGAPLDEKFQGTVTRGIVSANRILEGYSFIQSDVAVNPGNSGGPLVDDKSAVVGMTVSGRQPAGSQVGVNFFIPIRDALGFLAVDVK